MEDVPVSHIDCGLAYIPVGTTTLTSTQTISTGTSETRFANMVVRYFVRALPQC